MTLGDLIPLLTAIGHVILAVAAFLGIFFPRIRLWMMRPRLRISVDPIDKGGIQFKVYEIGYLPLNREESSLLFQLVLYRYEKSSTIFTSNKSFSEWGKAVGDQVIAFAILYRILHYCSTVNIRGDSYRLKDRRKSNPPPYGEEG